MSKLSSNQRPVSRHKTLYIQFLLIHGVSLVLAPKTRQVHNLGHNTFAGLIKKPTILFWEERA